MKLAAAFISTILVAVSAFPSSVPAEILAMMNYESKTPESIKSMKLTGKTEREEGIAIMDVDPNSGNFGKILMNIPLPADLVAHHIFYDRTQTKAYVTALGKGELRVFKLNEFPYRLKVISVPECQMGEDVIFSEDNKTWYLTCMNSANVYVGDTATDKISALISIPGTYPHGALVMTDIDRVLVTSTISGDLKTPDERITVIEASTNKVLGHHKVSNKKSPSGEAPVELLRVSGNGAPQALMTNMFGAALWTATWNAGKKDFDVAEVYDFAKDKAGVPLEMYFNKSGDRLYVTTANPGMFHIFDSAGGMANLKMIKTIPTAGGAHHVGLTKDGRYAIVQNAFINLPGMSDGSIHVVDLKSNTTVGTIDTLKKRGLNPNSLILLPKWNDLGGH